MPVWNEDTKTVFLAKFLDTTMSADTDGKYSYVKDYWRAKTYVKDEDKLLPIHDRMFPEPYQVAAKYCGGTWNDYNQPFIVQVGQCNLKCWWCFVADDQRNLQRGEFFSATQVVDWWEAHVASEMTAKHITEKRGVLRISGGEPFLAPEFLIAIGTEIAQRKLTGCYLWIDTNLLGTDYTHVIADLQRLHIPYGICGCFKGFDADDFAYQTVSPKGLYDQQFVHAAEIVSGLHVNVGSGEVFFYIPEITQPMAGCQAQRKIEGFMTLLQSTIHPNAPLRTTVLTLKEYSTNQPRMKTDRFPTGETKKLWLTILEKRFPLALRWLPQNQIPI